MRKSEDRDWNSDAVAEAWKRQAATRDTMLAAPTARMLDEARLRAGARVLDLGTGTGDTAVAAAERVGPSGEVVGTDASATMVEAARPVVAAAGAANVSLRTMDACAINLPPASFDAVIARLVLMFVDLPKALAGARDVLRPGGRFAALVWGTLADNPFQRIVFDAVRDEGGWGEPVPQGVIAFANDDLAIYRSALVAAGFTDVALHPAPTTRPFASAADARAWIAASVLQNEPLEGLARTRGEDARARAWARIEAEFRAFERGGACVFPALTWVCAGTRP